MTELDKTSAKADIQAQFDEATKEGDPNNVGGLIELGLDIRLGGCLALVVLVMVVLVMPAALVATQTPRVPPASPP